MYRVYDTTTNEQHIALSEFIFKHNLKSRHMNNGYYVSVPKELLDEFYKITGQYKEKCPECESYGRHSANCSLIDLESAIFLAKDYAINNHKYRLEMKYRYESENNNLKQQRDRYKTEMLKYKAKFNEVKHENNELRKKLK